MSAPAMNPRVLVVGLDAWGERVSERLAARIGHPLVPQLHVLALAETGEDPGTRRRLEWDARALMNRGIPFLTAVRADDGVWLGPAVVPTAAGCVRCWQTRRHEHAEMLVAREQVTGPPWAPLPGADVTLAVRAILAVGGRTIDAPDREAGVVRRFRDPGPAEARVDTAHLVPVAECARCNPRRRRRSAAAQADEATERDRPRRELALGDGESGGGGAPAPEQLVQATHEPHDRGVGNGDAAGDDGPGAHLEQRGRETEQLVAGAPLGQSEVAGGQDDELGARRRRWSS